ncbi:hypothetical protein [Sphingobacterium paucimobilis]|uniref:ACT domain-containing protein n=1 Tax=Sphingobacterium paucimobilis HER1398 TaxID=1346330 RepID=U2J8V3_9SPHI|nr:hypothetical protein [Sphingobacterium paucimobilis]ERJ59068.1 hypothetical protein M472_09820 [Sphingobacterium paucimobilis HER1398]
MTSKLFNISCKSSHDTLSKLLQHISTTGYRLCAVSQSATDVHEVSLITIELEIEARSIDLFIEEVMRIDGILDVIVSFGSPLKIATYQMRYDNDTLDLLDILRSHNTQVIHIEAKRLLIVHIATEKDIRLLYNKLDNASLLGFCQMPIAMADPLCWDKVNSK